MTAPTQVGRGLGLGCDLSPVVNTLHIRGSLVLLCPNLKVLLLLSELFSLLSNFFQNFQDCYQFCNHGNNLGCMSGRKLNNAVRCFMSEGGALGVWYGGCMSYSCLKNSPFNLSL